MAKSIIPKNCIVHSVTLDKKGAEVRFRCKRGGDLFYETGNQWYSDGKGGGSNYPHIRLRGVSSIRLPNGVVVSGEGARVGGFMKCKRSGRELQCSL